VKDKISELEINTNNQNITDLYRDIYEFKETYQLNQRGINVVDLTNIFAMQNFDIFIKLM
jgi:hypothetical protein